MSTAVVAYRGGEGRHLALQGLQAEIGQCWVGLDLGIEIGHIGPMVAIVVDRHRADPPADRGLHGHERYVQGEADRIRVVGGSRPWGVRRVQAPAVS